MKERIYNKTTTTALEGLNKLEEFIEKVETWNSDQDLIQYDVCGSIERKYSFFKIMVKVTNRNE